MRKKYFRTSLVAIGILTTFFSLEQPCHSTSGTCACLNSNGNIEAYVNNITSSNMCWNYCRGWDYPKYTWTPG